MDSFPLHLEPRCCYVILAKSNQRRSGPTCGERTHLLAVVNGVGEGAFPGAAVG